MISSIDKTDLVKLVNRYHRIRSSARFLQVIAKNSDLFDTLLVSNGVSEYGELARVKLRTAIIKAGNLANIMKFLNVIWILAGLSFIILATAWPDINARFQFSSTSLMVVLIQIALLAAAAFCGDQYQHCKTQQTNYEITLRETLFKKEALAVKLDRLKTEADKLSLFRKPNFKPDAITNFKWKFDNTQSLINHYEQVNYQFIDENDATVVAIQLKDAAIKRMAYSLLVNLFLALTVLVIITGVFLPILLKFFGFPTEQGFIGSYQALLIVGFGGLFWALRKQYIEKYRNIHSAMRELMFNSDHLITKSRKLHSEIGQIDRGMVI